LAEQSKSRLALVGPAALGLGGPLAAAGFELADGGAAVIDLAAAADRVPDVRRRYQPVIGLVPGDGAPPAASGWETLDAVIRLRNAATDLPPLLRTLIRAEREVSRMRALEAELRKAKEFLAEAEKAAVISELAGAAAHELNQPLTSVLGFSELLFRRTQENEQGREELLAIFREAERMAAIVRKIGTITRYETTAYVGKKRIVDLDRASKPPPPRDD
jgi:signal transduction histidine kinase